MSIHIIERLKKNNKYYESESYTLNQNICKNYLNKIEELKKLL